MSVLIRRLAGGLIALVAMATAAPAVACHFGTPLSATSTDTGAIATYSVTASPRWVCTETFGNPHNVIVTFPAGYDLSAASFNAAASGVRENTANPYTAFPAFAGAVVDAAARTVTISGIQYVATSSANASINTNYLLSVQGVRNPLSAGSYTVNHQFTEVGQTGSTGPFAGPIAISTTPGVNIAAAPPAPAMYAEEIIATPAAPVLLANGSGAINLITPLRYNFSNGEVRYARLECSSNLRFAAGSTATYSGGGSASVGAVNGLGTSAVNFSITANNSAVTADGRLTITGDRSITGTQNVTCTYSLYDFPSQAAAGGASGRLASVTGSYITFASSTVFTATSRSSVADVEADPAYSAFLPAAPTTATTAALARLTYALAAPAPRKADGNAIALVNLHATGASGTRIVVDGDFAAAANADGSYTGTAPARVYLSANNSTCVVAGSTPAATLSASQASFNVGATATDRMLCFAPRTGAAIPASDYTATLDGVSAAPTVYAVGDLGPRAAGSITRNGTQLQAPLVQLPGNGWLSRMVLTNTGAIARPYTVTVLRETGSAGTTANLTGTVPAKGTLVVDINTILPSFTTGATRATLNVTVAGPDKQIQGLYQIVNANSLTISNHVMVRPGTN